MSTNLTTRAVGIRNVDGPLEVLELPLVEPRAGEVRLKIAAAGVGMWDQYERHGWLGDLPLPRALGWEGSGVVEAVGEEVSDLSVGDAVIAYVRLAGFYSERVVVPADAVARAPQNMRFELFSRGDRATLDAIVELVERGVLHIHVGGRYPLSDAQHAQDQLATRHGRGRVLLIP
jgi:NADPH:quinone reductase-like Zn-dependent oxidoreductase